MKMIVIKNYKSFPIKLKQRKKKGKTYELNKIMLFFDRISTIIREKFIVLYK